MKTPSASLLTDSQIEEALLEHNGKIHLTAKALGYSGSWLGVRIRKSEHLFDLWKNLREERLDRAENVLEEAEKAGDLKAIFFTLRTIGKDRGYVERQEVTGIDGGPIAQTIGPDLTEMTDAKLFEYLQRLAETSYDIASTADAARLNGDNSQIGDGEEARE